MASGEAFPKTSGIAFSATRTRAVQVGNPDERPLGNNWMIKRSNQFRQHIPPSMVDRQVLLPIGRFAGEAWVVRSLCGTYRYRLVRVWDSHKPRLGVVGHCWSAASEWLTDPAMRRCARFARAWGYGGIDIGNLFGLQTADAGNLASVDDPVGPDNDAHLGAIYEDNDLILLAWGNGADPDRAHRVAQMLWHLGKQCGGSLAVLGWTECGQPRHPLYAPKDSTPECLTLSPKGHGLHETEDPRWERLLAGEA
jgi:hypothetical protein